MVENSSGIGCHSETCLVIPPMVSNQVLTTGRGGRGGGEVGIRFLNLGVLQIVSEQRTS